MCSHVEDFNARNKCLTAKLLRQGYRYHKLRKAFSKFYRRHHELCRNKISCTSRPIVTRIYGDFVQKFIKIMGMTTVSDQFRKIIICQKRICYSLNVMRQSACLVIKPITVDNLAAYFNCTPVDRAPDSMMARHKAVHFSWLRPELFCLLRGPPGLN